MSLFGGSWRALIEWQTATPPQTSPGSREAACPTWLQSLGADSWPASLLGSVSLQLRGVPGVTPDSFFRKMLCEPRACPVLVVAGPSPAPFQMPPCQGLSPVAPSACSDGDPALFSRVLGELHLSTFNQIFFFDGKNVRTSKCG